MKSNHLNYVDALRGYAILLVMMVHLSQFCPVWQGWGRQLINQGAKGVQLFFVASAFTLMLSWQNRNDGAINFYIRRLFRIVPMFWLAIIFFVLIDGYGPRYFAPKGITNHTVFLTALFANGWHPETISSVVPGGWSIVVEMTFYLVFPLLMLLIKNLRSALIFFVVANGIAYNSYIFFWKYHAFYWPGVSDDVVGALLALWFPNQLPVFASGFILFFMIRDFKAYLQKKWIMALLALSLTCMVILVFYPELKILHKLRMNTFSAYGVCFGIFAYCLSEYPMIWLVNPLICYLGKISYSAYLCHFVVLGILTYYANRSINLLHLYDPLHGFPHFLIKLPFFVLIITVFSTITYRLIEKPMIRAGNLLIKRLEARKNSEPVTVSA